MPFSDEWLVPTLVTVVPEAQIVRLRRELDGTPSVWEAVVDRRFATDDQVLQAVSARFRLPMADLPQIEPRIQDSVPEQGRRKYNVLPVRILESYRDMAPH